MTLTLLTPKQAAERAKVSRGTIMNAISDGSLSASRKNSGNRPWQIHPDKLSEWMANRGGIATDIDTDKGAKSDTPKPDENALRIAVLEVELKARDQRISDLEREQERAREGFDREREDLKRDRDSWKEQAQQLARRPRRWWPF